MTEISDARPAAWVCAWNAIQAVQELKKPRKGATDGEPLPELYWATIAEAAIFAQLAQADVTTGLHAGTLLTAVERAKQEAIATLTDIFGA